MIRFWDNCWVSCSPLVDKVTKEKISDLVGRRCIYLNVSCFLDCQWFSTLFIMFSIPYLGSPVNLWYARRIKDLFQGFKNTKWNIYLTLDEKISHFFVIFLSLCFRFNILALKKDLCFRREIFPRYLHVFLRFLRKSSKKTSELSQVVFKDLCNFSIKITWAHLV